MNKKINLKKLKEDFNRIYTKLYNEGVRGIYLTNSYIHGVYVDDFQRSQHRKKEQKIKKKHRVNLQKYKIKLQKKQKIYVGGSHIYIK